MPHPSKPSTAAAPRRGLVTIWCGGVQPSPTKCVCPSAESHGSGIGLRLLSLCAGLDVVALEQLRALLAPGLDRAHGLARLGLVATADARAAVELRFGQVLGQIDRLLEESVSTESSRWLL